MDKFITTDNGGLPFVLDDLRWILGQSASNGGLYNALQDILRGFGQNFIVQGCDSTSFPNITEGWILLSGELLKVDAHTATGAYFSKNIIYDATGDKTFQNGASYKTYEKNRAICDSSSGLLRYNDPDMLSIITSSLQFASTSTIGVVRLATKSETTALSSSSIAITPNGLSECLASTSQLGIISTSTNAQTQAGTSSSVAVTPASLESRQATTTMSGIQANATDVEAKALASTSKTITPSTLSSVTGGLLNKVIEIGDWDMDTTTTVKIAHGLSNYKKFRGTVDVVIRDDSDTYYWRLDSMQASSGSCIGIDSSDSTKIRLDRVNGGIFDTVDFNSTSYNRGWVTIAYIP